MSYHLGIDLGTTYTGAARFSEGRGEVITLGDRAAVVPSVLYMREDGDVLAGDPAVRRGISDPTRVVREFKRRMGDPTPIMVGHSPYSADRLMAELLDTVLGVVSQREGGPPEGVGITHPANWGPYKQDILEQAVRLADVHDAVILSEPEAAAIHYAWTERIDHGEIVAVYDLGGGTFDVAVLRKIDGAQQFEILGEAEGIERLGGVDFDEAVYQFVVRFLGAAVSGLDPDDPAVVQGVARLRQECVAAKEALSADTDVSIPVFLPNIQTEVRLTRPEFEAMIRPAIGETIDAMRRALRGAGVAADDLSTVLLVGGSSRIPLVSQLVTAELGRPTALDIHPKHTVALGAAIASFYAAEAKAGRTVGLVEPPARSEDIAQESVLAATGSDGPGGVVEDTRPLTLVGDEAQPPVENRATPTEPVPTDQVPTDQVPTDQTAPRPPAAPEPPPTDVPSEAPRREPPTADSDVAAGDAVGGGPADGGAAPPGAPLPPPIADRRSPIALVGAVGAVIVLIAAGWWIFGRGDGDVATTTTVLAQESTTTVADSTTTTAAETTTTTVDPIEIRDPEGLQVVDSVGGDGAPVLAAAGSGSDTLGTLPALTTFTTSGRVETVDDVEWFELAEPVEGGWISADATQAVEPGERVTITDIQIENDRYAVYYEANYEPLIQNNSDEIHIHFFWNVYDVHEAGAGPDRQTWILYDVPSPFTGYAVADRPDGATQLCATPATSGHAVLNERVFNCMDLPDI